MASGAVEASCVVEVEPTRTSLASPHVARPYPPRRSRRPPPRTRARIAGAGHRHSPRGIRGGQVARPGGARSLLVRDAAGRTADPSAPPDRIVHRQLAHGLPRAARSGGGARARASCLHLRTALQSQAVDGRGDARPQPGARPHPRSHWGRRDPDASLGARAHHHRRGARARGQRTALAADGGDRARGGGEPRQPQVAGAADAAVHLPHGWRCDPLSHPVRPPDGAPGTDAREPARRVARVRVDPAPDGCREDSRHAAWGALGRRRARLPSGPRLWSGRGARALPALLQPRRPGVVRQVADVATRSRRQLSPRPAHRPVRRLRAHAPARQDPRPEGLLRHGRGDAPAHVAARGGRERPPGRRARRVAGDGPPRRSTRAVGTPRAPLRAIGERRRQAPFDRPPGVSRLPNA